MASGIFAILDDVAALLDDAATISKIAVKKTAGVLGDDLAVNAEKATGFHASRELPVIWAITQGSLLNKLIILPIAFLLSAFVPWLIAPILLLGGAYLSYEGAEKVLEWFLPHPPPEPAAARVDDARDRVQAERAKIRAAVRTDFILSIEIIVIALGTVMDQSLMMQVLVVGFIALLATVGVYGLVALLVRMDDAGLYLIAAGGDRRDTLGGLLRRAGRGLVAALPWVIRVLGVLGTVAMLLVGGGMFVHHIPALHHALALLPGLLPDLLVGLLLGASLVAVMQAIARWRRA